MPPRTRRGAPRGGAAASRASASASASASAPLTPKQEDTSSLSSHPLATVISSSESTHAPSIPPASTSTASTAAPRIPAATAAAAATASGARSFVFKPKVVRRADEERKALAEQEEKKFNDRAAEEARLKRAASRGRGRGRGGRGRGRGDFGGGRDGLVRRTVAPDGPFSQVPGATGAPGGAGGRGGFRGSANGGGFSAGGGGGVGGGRGGGSTFSAVAADYEYDPRLNTDTFMGRSPGEAYADTKDELAEGQHGGPSGSASTSAAGGGGGRSKASNLLPMGIRREEHREPEVVVTTTAELEAADAAAAAAAADAAADNDDDDDDDNSFSSDSDMFFENSAPGAAGLAGGVDDDDNEVWSRAITSRGGVKLVGADGQEIEVTDIDTLAEKREEVAAALAARAAAGLPSSSSLSAAVVKEEADDAAPSLDSLSVPAAAEARESKKARKKKLAAAKLLPKDPEDITVEQGLQAMLHDLAMDQPPQQQPARQVAADAIMGDGGGGGGDAPQTTESAETKEQPRREGRLFLFQFPPVLPSLKPFEPAGQADDGDSSSSRSNSYRQSSAHGLVKQEPGADGDVVMLDGVTPAPIDLTDEGQDEKGEKGDKGGKERANLADIGQGGFLGTLSIRKSGRAELSWGGMTYEMMPGTDVQFLTTAVLLEESDEKRKPGEAGAGPALVGNAFGMGPVGGKYNLVPVFSDESEWVVDPSELVLDGVEYAA